ncbi:MAG: hypothetical protein P1U58_17595 [Verrucomicrobiales bacterium]|nr:hypothetical protein [Verrucomicrobiales bacterium]
MQTRDYDKIPPSRRSLFYRYGPIVFDDEFDFALGIYRESGASPRPQDYEEGPWASGVSSIRRILEAIESGEQSPYDGDRLLFQDAYEELLRSKRRPPTQSELFQARWSLGVRPNIEKHRSEWMGALLEEKLHAIYSGDLVDEKIPKPPRDKKSYREKSGVMGLVLLDGHKLRRYEKLFDELKASNGNRPPNLPEFVRHSLKRSPPESISARSLPFPDFIELFATPFSWLPGTRWTQGQDLFSGVIDQALKTGNLSEESKNEISTLHSLILGFGEVLESLIENNLPNPSSKEENRWNLEQKRIFYKTVSRLEKIPDFCSMWLENPEWGGFIDDSGDQLDFGAKLFKDLGEIYREVHQGISNTPTVEQIAAELPVVGVLADLVGPEAISREPMLYFCSLDMERS